MTGNTVLQTDPTKVHHSLIRAALQNRADSRLGALQILPVKVCCSHKATTTTTVHCSADPAKLHFSVIRAAVHITALQ